MREELALLIVEDSEDDAELLVRELHRGGYDVEHSRVDTPETLRSALGDRQWDLVIADFTMPRFSGTQALAMVRAHSIDLPFLFVSGTIGEETAIAALKAGAQDYFVKGQSRRLLPAIGRELREAEARRERTRLDVERRAVEQRYRQVLTIAADGVIVADGNLKIAIFNRGAERIFGYKSAVVIGQPLDVLWPPRVAAANRKRIVDFILTPEMSEIENGDELIALRSNGEEFPVEASLSKLGEDGRATVTMIVRDVSDRKRAEKKLRQLSRAVEQSANLVIITDASGTIEYVNPRFLESTGYAPEEIIGRRPFFWKASAGNDALDHEIWQAVLNGKDWRGEFENERRDRSRISVSATISPVTDETGRIAHVIAIEEDVTRRKEVEAQLKQAQKMEAIGLLTGGIAHDFNNLLAVIIGNLDLLAGQLGSDDESQTGIQLALAASLRGADLTRQLLAFARQQPLSPRVFDLNKLVVETVTMLRRILGEKVEIRSILDTALWPAEADATQVETTLANLAINARDAMPDGGVLSIITTSRHMDQADVAEMEGLVPGDYVVLTVDDTGTGIPPEILDRVCEPFFTTKPPGKGTGLGLSMVYGFAKQSGGHLSIESEVGRGSTLRLYLPRAKTEAPAETPASDGNPARGVGLASVLVVEDNRDVCDVVVRQLLDLGYRVEAVENAAGAVALLESEKSFDLLFSDVVLPGGMSGQALARAARLLRPGIKVLLTSGFAAGTSNGERIEEGVAFIGKPYRRFELARKIQTVLEADT